MVLQWSAREAKPSGATPHDNPEVERTRGKAERGDGLPQ